MASEQRLDPAKYEIFLHRLYMIGEEGRATLQRVTASPIVSQGGECMTSFYDANGTMIIACSGHLRFAAASSDGIKKILELYGDDLNPGDQFFQNDPYVAGAHTYDQTTVKPLFHKGRRIAWVATSSHTADTGGVLRGEATEIYHEGVKTAGLKIIGGEKFREDAFNTIIYQCRDPQYVGLDLKSRIAANNVAERRFSELVEKFGIEFVESACEKIIHDAELMSRKRINSLPDGVWRSRLYGATHDRKLRKDRPYKILCEMTKKGEVLRFNFEGTSPQNPNTENCTLACTRAILAVPLLSFLFWDIHWSDGAFAPVKLDVPEGSVLNCRFPAACGLGPSVGGIARGAVMDCIARMLFAGGFEQNVNTVWHGFLYFGGPGFLYGGHDRRGIPVPQGIYDIHGAGLGATPERDGVHAGGNMYIPSGGISDVELVELQYPLLYFTRNLCTDGGGEGKFNGGTGTQRIYMVYGSKDFSVDVHAYSRIIRGAKGLFGGNPVGPGGIRSIFSTNQGDLTPMFQKSDYPFQVHDLLSKSWEQNMTSTPRIVLPEYSVIADFVGAGGGYGDPLERNLTSLDIDLKESLVSPRAAEKFYGAVLDDDSSSVNIPRSEARRQQIKNERMESWKPFESGKLISSGGSTWDSVLRFHEYLEIASNGKSKVVRCIKCGYLFCNSDENYKRFANRSTENPFEMVQGKLSLRESSEFLLVAYACPGCGTLLEIDQYCPEVDGNDEPIWDTCITV